MITVISDKPPTLGEAQTIVGEGNPDNVFVEMVTLADGTQMLVDEEGLLKKLPVNIEASMLAGRMIVGHALILEGPARWT